MRKQKIKIVDCDLENCQCRKCRKRNAKLKCFECQECNNKPCRVLTIEEWQKEVLISETKACKVDDDKESVPEPETAEIFN